jgi:hypothetical protein
VISLLANFVPGQCGCCDYPRGNLTLDAYAIPGTEIQGAEGAFFSLVAAQFVIDVMKGTPGFLFQSKILPSRTYANTNLRFGTRRFHAGSVLRMSEIPGRLPRWHGSASSFLSHVLLLCRVGNLLWSWFLISSRVVSLLSAGCPPDISFFVMAVIVRIAVYRVF